MRSTRGLSNLIDDSRRLLGTEIGATKATTPRIEGTNQGLGGAALRNAANHTESAMIGCDGGRMFRFMRRKNESKSMSVGVASSADGYREAGVPGPAPSVRRRVDEAIQSAAAFAVTSAASEQALFRALERIRRGEEQGPVVWELHAGLLEFLRSVFPKGENSSL
jgi:hypothetical protein